MSKAAKDTTFVELDLTISPTEESAASLATHVPAKTKLAKGGKVKPQVISNGKGSDSDAEEESRKKKGGTNNKLKRKHATEEQLEHTLDDEDIQVSEIHLSHIVTI
jgi:hypothetical protein